MPATSLPALEQDLEARLLELEKLHHSRPALPSALARAEAGERIDELLDEIAELQRMIDTTPAETLEDAAVKLRRLSAYVDGGQPARLLAGALGGRGEGGGAGAAVGNRAGLAVRWISAQYAREECLGLEQDITAQFARGRYGHRRPTSYFGGTSGRSGPDGLDHLQLETRRRTSPIETMPTQGQ